MKEKENKNKINEESQNCLVKEEEEEEDERRRRRTRKRRNLLSYHVWLLLILSTCINPHASLWCSGASGATVCESLVHGGGFVCTGNHRGLHRCGLVSCWTCLLLSTGGVGLSVDGWNVCSLEQREREQQFVFFNKFDRVSAERDDLFPCINRKPSVVGSALLDATDALCSIR